MFRLADQARRFATGGAAGATACTGRRRPAAASARADPRSSGAPSSGRSPCARWRGRASLAAGHDRDDMPARGQAAAAVVAGALVPGQEQESAGPDRAQQRRDQPAQEAIAGRGDAIVHVVAEVRGDPHEARQRLRAFFGGQPGSAGPRWRTAGRWDDARVVRRTDRASWRSRPALAPVKHGDGHVLHVGPPTTMRLDSS